MPVHVAILRRVRPGQEAAFEQAIEAFFALAAAEPGSLGAQLIRPLPGSDQREYGILRSFTDETSKDKFYASESFAAWEQGLAPFVEGPARRQPLHGLEVWFRGPAPPPPRWKMALVSWSGVWPTVFMVSTLLNPHLKSMPVFLAVGVNTFFIVMLLTWAVMPNLTRWLRPWLHASPQGSGVAKKK